MTEKAKITTKTPEAKKNNKVFSSRKPDFLQPTGLPFDHIFFLQRTLGNQAVQRLFKYSTPVVSRTCTLHVQRVPADENPLNGMHHEGTLPYREATELLECIKIMGEANAAYCREAVLGEKPQPRPIGTANWLSPVINRRNFAEVHFRSTGLGGTGGLTTTFINEREIRNNLDVEAAIPRPPVESRPKDGMTACWFTHVVNATGRTTMDIFSSGPWNFTAPRAEIAARYSWNKSCKEGSDPATIHIDARPSDAAMEAFVRLGEAEHDSDSHRAFNDNIAVYVGNVARLIGDTPTTRVVRPNIVECLAELRRLENRDLLTQFVIDKNAATDRRHAGGRHGIAHTGILINRGCSRITEEMHAGSL